MKVPEKMTAETVVIDVATSHAIHSIHCSASYHIFHKKQKQNPQKKFINIHPVTET